MRRMTEAKGSRESLLTLNVQYKQKADLFHKMSLGEI